VPASELTAGAPSPLLPPPPQAPTRSEKRTNVALDAVFIARPDCC